MEIINNNPFRILGIYSNSSAKDIASHISKAKAWAEVNKNAVFSEDMRPALPEFTRNTESLNAAQTKINLPADKLKYALFWFCYVSSIDGIALGHLQTGNVDKALELFGKRPSYSSLINKGALILSQGDNLKEGIACIAKVIHDGRYRNAFVNTICGETFKIDEDQLSQLFIDALLSEISASTLLDIFQVINISSSDCDYLKAKTVGEPIAAINEAIAAASSISRNDASANYDAGVKLINNTKESLKQLKALLSETDVQYIRTADNLAKAISQCSINYHNNTDDDNDVKIEKAFELQNYALSIAAGRLTKDRCQDQVDKLTRNRDALNMEKKIGKDLKSISDELKSFRTKSDSISNAKSLINNCKPYLQIIKNQLGSTDEQYLLISSAVANNALGMCVKVVNHAQSSFALSTTSLNTLKNTINDAYSAMNLIGTLDMTSQERSHFNTNKATLQNLKKQIDLVLPPTPPTPPPPGPDPGPDWGCIIWIIILAICFVCGLAGC